MVNTKHIQELIKDGEIDRIKEAMEQSLSPGSQTFEQALFRLYQSGKITLEEAMGNSDSPTNLHWLINNASKAAAPAQTTANMASGVASSRPAAPQNDLSSIKLNLDALG
jgi:twitching motility protein PilU